MCANVLHLMKYFGHHGIDIVSLNNLVLLFLVLYQLVLFVIVYQFHLYMIQLLVDLMYYKYVEGINQWHMKNFWKHFIIVG